jgi:hypothetical protein
MQSDEEDIKLYLKSYPGQFISAREIARWAGGKVRYRNDPSWAAAVLTLMVEKGVVESDSTGHFRLVTKKQNKRDKKWVSPQMRKILEESGKDFTHIVNEKDLEDDLT